MYSFYGHQVIKGAEIPGELKKGLIADSFAQLLRKPKAEVYQLLNYYPEAQPGIAATPLGLKGPCLQQEMMTPSY